MIYSLRNRNFRIVFSGDIFLLLLAHYFAYYIRFDGAIENDQIINFLRVLPWMIPIKILALFYFDLYKGMWRYTGIYDLINLIKAVGVSSVLVAFILLVSVHFMGFSRGVFAIDFMLTLLLIGGFRVGIRLMYSVREGEKAFLFKGPSRDKKSVLVIGAGAAGEKLVREIRENPHLNYDLVGFIDDDSNKTGRTIHGISILGTLDEMKEIATSSHADEIVIAMPSASAINIRRAVNFCESTGLPYKTLPGIGELIEGRVSVSAIRDVRYEDLLGRKPVELEVEQIGGYLTGKRIMVTGGAGSIGSELCRQIVPFKPERLIIVDRNESGLYETEMDFLSKYPELKLVPVLGPVQTRDLMEKVFEENRPQVVFHAAAYKHVPMMEIHPWEAVYNNILGTKTLLEMCRENGVERYVLVSTDKAVRPTNVMGTSKRVAELLTQGCAREYNSVAWRSGSGTWWGASGALSPFSRSR